MNSAISLFLMMLVVLLAPLPAWADDMDIFGANIEPNVMILIDSSQSMNDSITSIPWDPGPTGNPPTTAPAWPTFNICEASKTSPCVTQTVYKRTGTLKWEFYKSSIANVTGTGSSSARTALYATGFWSGTIGGSPFNLFVGNYLNYQYGVCATTACTEPKITIAKRVITNLIQNTEGVRFGAMKFKLGGGQVIAQIGANKTTLINAVNNMTLTSVSTLTGEQIRDAGTYYKGNLGFPSPITLGCQPNFVIVVSDGLYKGINPVPEAAKLFAGPPPTNDHSSTFTGIQKVTVHAVGFGIGASEPADDLAANDVLRATAQAGGGLFFKTDSASQLEAALQEMMTQISGSIFTFAAPVLPTTSTSGSTRAYLASFQSDPSRPFWQGFLRAYERDSDGLVRLLANGKPDPAYQQWDAGERLAAKSAGSRTMFTSNGALRQDFVKSNTFITTAMLNAASATERDKIIDFTRGTDSYDEDGDSITNEDRGWKLGDIFHSTPVLVGVPNLAIPDPTYTAFKSANTSRVKVLISGSNDGMLHAFRESDGEELWAYVPPPVLGRLKDLTPRSGDHPFFVDSSPIAADVKISGWRTIVVGGLRRGGPHYYALDITDTTAPLPMWTFTDPNLGETWSEPAIGKVRVGGADKYVAFFGGGYDTGLNNRSGKGFYVLDLATGTKLWEYRNDGSGGDRQYMNFSVAGNPTAVDMNNDGYIDRVYIGDVGGQVWKFDISSQSTTSEWLGQRVFAAAPSQANPPAPGEFYPEQGIYGSPSLAFDDSMNLWVFVGTGDRNHPNNVSSNRFYGFKDTTNMAQNSAITEGSLTNITSTVSAAPNGWYIVLSANEKALSSANVFNKIVLFTTFTPDDPSTPTTCESGGGEARLYAINMDTRQNVFSTRSVSIGRGIPSTPVVVMTVHGAEVRTSVVTATTSEELPNNPITPPDFMKRFLFWRELMGS